MSGARGRNGTQLLSPLSTDQLSGYDRDGDDDEQDADDMFEQQVQLIDAYVSLDDGEASEP